MQNSKKKKRVKIFLDANILVAAAFSVSGGSSRVIHEALDRNVVLVATQYVLDEAERAIRSKRPNAFPRFRVISQKPFLTIVGKPSDRAVEIWAELIKEKDAPVLAGAAKAKANILLTLDRQDFLENRKLLSSPHSFAIMNPGELIKKYFSNEQ
jgi:putative PIN family toxin of toxin-antitoxin system